MKKRVAEFLDQVTIVLEHAKRANQGPDAYPYLPGIIQTLERIQQILRQRSPDVRSGGRLVGGIGRVVTEDFDFAESPLGQELLRIVNSYTFDKT